MQSMADTMQGLFSQWLASGLLRDCGECPQCGGKLMCLVNRKTGSDRSLPACAECGYKETNGTVSDPHKKAREWSQTAAKKDAINYLVNSSVFSDQDVINKTFANYVAQTPAEKAALKTAQHIVTEIVNEQVVSAMFTGGTGRGKTHLAMAVLYGVLSESNYHKRCMFLNYRELLRQMQASFGNNEEQRKYNDLVTNQIKEADVVVIDDLGSEVRDEAASRYDIEIATSIYDARVSKATITTTNLGGAKLREIYGNRVVSRMVEHSKDNNILFKDMVDHRVVSTSKT